jgi:hypothetical protein
MFNSKLKLVLIVVACLLLPALATAQVGGGISSPNGLSPQSLFGGYLSSPTNIVTFFKPPAGESAALMPGAQAVKLGMQTWASGKFYAGKLGRTGHGDWVQSCALTNGSTICGVYQNTGSDILSSSVQPTCLDATAGTNTCTTADGVGTWSGNLGSAGGVGAQSASVPITNLSVTGCSPACTVNITTSNTISATIVPANKQILFGSNVDTSNGANMLRDCIGTVASVAGSVITLNTITPTATLCTGLTTLTSQADTGTLWFPSNYQNSVPDRWWLYVFSTHDAFGNVTSCNSSVLLMLVEWNTFDTTTYGAAGPTYNFATEDANLTSVITDPTYIQCALTTKLALVMQPVDAAGSNPFVGGNIATPTWIFSQPAANALAPAWAPSTQYWFHSTVIVPGGVTTCGTPCYEYVTAVTGNAGIGTSGTTTPSWTTGAPPQTTTDNGITWTSIANAPPQEAGTDAATNYKWTASAAGDLTLVNCGNGFYSILWWNNSCNTSAAPTPAGLAFGLPYIGGTPYQQALKLAYAAFIQHYNLPQWQGYMNYARLGQLKGGQNIPYLNGELINAPAATGTFCTTAGPAATCTTPSGPQTTQASPCTAADTYVLYWAGMVGSLYDAISALPSRFPINVSPSSANTTTNTGDPTCIADAEWNRISNKGANSQQDTLASSEQGLNYGADASRSNTYPVPLPTDSNWVYWANALNSKNPQFSVQMTATSGGNEGTNQTCAYGGVGTVAQNEAWAAKNKATVFELLGPDQFMTFDPAQIDNAICGMDAQGGLKAFTCGDPYSLSPQMLVGIQNPVPTFQAMDVASAINIPVTSNAATGNSVKYGCGGMLSDLNCTVAISGNGTGAVSISGISNPVTGISGGVEYFNTTTSKLSSALLTNNVVILGGGAGNPPKPSLATDNGTTLNYTGTGGITTPLVVTTGVVRGSNTVRLTADSAGITATTPGTTFLTLPTLIASTNYSFICELLYSQATAVALDGMAVQAATNAATDWDAWGTMYVTDPITGAVTGSQSSALRVTTTTATPIVTATPGVIGTVYQARIAGNIQVGASVPTMNIAAFTGSGSDAITIKAGSFCTVTP